MISFEIVRSPARASQRGHTQLSRGLEVTGRTTALRSRRRRIADEEAKPSSHPSVASVRPTPITFRPDLSKLHDSKSDEVRSAVYCTQFHRSCIIHAMCAFLSSAECGGK